MSPIPFLCSLVIMILNVSINCRSRRRHSRVYHLIAERLCPSLNANRLSASAY
jgi:hypothetical protein